MQVHAWACCKQSSTRDQCCCRWELVEAGAGAPVLHGATLPLGMTGPQAIAPESMHCIQTAYMYGNILMTMVACVLPPHEAHIGLA